VSRDIEALFRVVREVADRRKAREEWPGRDPERGEELHTHHPVHPVSLGTKLAELARTQNPELVAATVFNRHASANAGTLIVIDGKR